MSSGDEMRDLLQRVSELVLDNVDKEGWSIPIGLGHSPSGERIYIVADSSDENAEYDPEKYAQSTLAQIRRMAADGQIRETHSISAGLDYPSVGPEHAWLRDRERAFYTYATDGEALAAFHELSQTEGIIPALESAHAVAEAIKRAPTMRPDQILLVNLSGRGDKDLDTVLRLMED